MGLTVSWHAFAFRSGRRGPRVDVAVQGTIGRIIGEPTDAEVQVRIWDAETGTGRPEALTGTEPGPTMLVALDEATEQPVWGGVVLRQGGDAGEWATCTLATLEHYLDRRYPGTVAYSGTEQATIAAGLVNAVAPDGIGFTVDAPATGVRRDLTVEDDEDKTVLAILTEQMKLADGLEFTVELEWADPSRTVLAKIIRFRQRLGTAPVVPFRFEFPGAVTDFTWTRDYTDEWGANDTMATSSGQGSARPTSAHQVAQDLLDGGWPKYERRFTPSTSITRIDTLNAHAAEELAAMKLGSRTFTLAANLDEAPQIGVDVHLGDDVTLAIEHAPAFPRHVDADGRMRLGYEQRVRLTGWELDLDARIFTPTLREV